MFVYTHQAHIEKKNINISTSDKYYNMAAYISMTSFMVNLSLFACLWCTQNRKMRLSGKLTPRASERTVYCQQIFTTFDVPNVNISFQMISWYRKII